MVLQAVPDPAPESTGEPWEYPEPEGPKMPPRKKQQETDLGGAAADAMDDAEDFTLSQDQGPEGQQALVPACHVKIQGGVKLDLMKSVPKIGDTIRLLVEARVVAHEQVERADGEIREVAKVKAQEVELADGE